MLKKNQQARWGRRNRLPMMVVGICIGLLMVVGSLMVVRAVTSLRELAVSGSDNIIWTVSQAEVELLEFDRSLLSAALPGGATADDVRIAFDVLYSRINLLNESRYYQQVIKNSGGDRDLAKLIEELNSLIPIIDGSDAGLLDDLFVMHELLEPLRVSIHGIASRITRQVSIDEEQIRLGLYEILRNIAIVVTLLIVSMGMLSVLIWRLFVSARLRAMDLSLATARLEAIVETSQDALIVADQNDQITEFNGAAEKLLGYSKPEVLGANLSMLYDQANVSGGEQIRRRVEGLHKNGNRLQLEVSRGEVSTELGAIRVYVLRDISLRLSTEEALRQSRDRALEGERAKARFLTVMSHEMRTPLNGILGAIGLMREKASDPELEQYMEILESAGEDLLNHVDNVLDITRIEAMGIGQSNDRINLEAISKKILLGFEDKAQERGIRLHSNMHLQSGNVVIGDSVRVSQIISNMLDNALKHTSEGEISLEISSSPRGAEPLVEIQVADTGDGIPLEDQQRIFEDFVQLTPAEGRSASGTGLGLGITRRLVKAMGGEIGVESEPGEGSLFWVRLPLKPEPEGKAQSDQPDDDVETEVEPQNVLIVEDNSVNRFILREMLLKDGHTVVEAENGEIGVQKAEEQVFDLILMDISMPIMDGYAATTAIRTNGGPNTRSRIVALTAHIYAEERSECRAAGFDYLVTKPITWSALRSLLRGEGASLASPNLPEETLRDVPLIDPRTWRVLQRTMGIEKLTYLVGKFLKEGEALMGRLNAPDEEREAPADLVAPVHSLAGGAATLGARRLHGALSEVETAFRNGNGAMDLNPLWQATSEAYADRVSDS